jgi:hypothetical protein
LRIHTECTEITESESVRLPLSVYSVISVCNPGCLIQEL